VRRFRGASLPRPAKQNASHFVPLRKQHLNLKIRLPFFSVLRLHSRPMEGKSCARRLRQSMPDAQRRLWRLLRDRRFAGYKFRREHPVGPYTLDFYCAEAGVSVEVDGRQRPPGSARSRSREGELPVGPWHHHHTLLELANPSTTGGRTPDALATAARTITSTRKRTGRSQSSFPQLATATRERKAFVATKSLTAKGVRNWFRHMRQLRSLDLAQVQEKLADKADWSCFGDRGRDA